MAFTDKFLYIAHHFILVPHNAFGLGVNREWWWFEHSVSWLRIWLSAEASENVSWFTLSPLRGWGNFIMAFTGKFVYVAHHLILLRFIPFGIGVARSGWYVEYSLLWLRVWLLTGGAKNVSWLSLFPLRGRGSLTMAFTAKFVCITHHFILVRHNSFGLGVGREGWWFEHSVSWLLVWLSAEASENVSWLRLSLLRGWVIWLWLLLVSFYI